MEEQLRNQLVEQQQQQQQLLEQVNVLQKQLAEQTMMIHGMKTTKFDLSPDQIIRNFNEIPPFSGDDTYKLKSFLKCILDTESLCGQNNEELKQYCLRKLINNKIIGSARNSIMEIPENQRTWTSVIQQLRLRYRPKNTIHQLLFNAKEIKVFNLKDLFNKLNRIKSECSEICDFDDEDNFTYHSIDRELVQILKSKIIPIVQMQIDCRKSLFELDNILCQSEIYLTEDIIKSEYKINRNLKFIHERKNNSINNSNNNYNYNSRNNGNNYVNNNLDKNGNNYNSTNYNKSRQLRLPELRINNQNNSGQFRLHELRSNNQNNQGQFRSPNIRTNSEQYRRQFETNRSNQYRNNHIPNQESMEVDNITRNPEFNQEVNFIEQPHQTNYL